ncbi:MAG TPA: alpha-amylase family glycosyl hydrolase [Anaerolineaceae bacterium]
MTQTIRRLTSWFGIVILLLGGLGTYQPPRAAQAAAPAVAPAALPAANTPNPTSVTIAGDLQSALGCAGNWDPGCAATHLTYDANDDVWQGTFNVPAGNWLYKAALNNSWDENYGKNATRNGDNIALNLASATSVKFYYDHKTHWITDNLNSIIATVPGSFQSKLGCSGDWDPGCLRSWLEDPAGTGNYAFSTTAIPAGSYEAKVAINESWNVNYGQGGAPGGGNIPFTVEVTNSTVTFSWNATSHVLTITVEKPKGHFHDNNVEWNGLRHDSRDLLYRTPGGAVPAGTPVMLRFRTYHNDVTSVKVRLYNADAGGQTIQPMALAASDVSCYQVGLEGETCDYWQVTLPNATPATIWYRFIIADGTATAYYADNTPALDGGLGAPSANVVDNSYALTVYDPAFTAPTWAKDSVIYQIFPDRFRSGNPTNNPQTGQLRYDDPVLALNWGMLPEGFCRNYADAATNCPYRFGPAPAGSNPTVEQPRGRDYFGGDLKGVLQSLDYLQALGVTTIYFNPIFDAKSNHRYDTADYTQIDPALGSLKDFQQLVMVAKNHGINLVLDGVFNHMSSDSPAFDRYHHYVTDGACESASSAFRPWFTFRAPAGNEPSPCVPSTPGGKDTYYTGWFGFDSIPVITKTLPQVQSFFITAPDSITRTWLNRGAQGWRLDVMGDSSFPNGYWETFRGVVKNTNPDALIIGELWQKDNTLLRFLRGDRADTTMDYRLRDAVVGLLAPQAFDSKGFADSGHTLKPSEFAARLSSIREDYPDAAYYSLMNLLDSHDTERLRWTLTPGSATTADKEQNAANVSAGKQRQQLASLIQFTVPGAPTVYYGDEVGMTGGDDPDDRRTFPWPDLGGQPDYTMLNHYVALTQMRKANKPLTDGDLHMLLANDADQTVAYGRKTNQGAALVALNLSNTPRTLTIPVAGYLPEGLTLTGLYAVNGSSAVSAATAGGMVQLTLNAMSGLVLSTGSVDLTPPAAPQHLMLDSEGDGTVAVSWDAVTGAAGYNLYRSPLSGGGYVKVNDALLTGLSFTDSGLRNATNFYYTVRAVNAMGIESVPSNEIVAMPHLVIGWANTQWPPTLTHTISVVNRTDNVYGQVWIKDVTSVPGATPTLVAQLGFGPQGSNPAGNKEWAWVDTTFNGDRGNNDEYVASLLPDKVGVFDYLYRYTTTNGRDWLYADLGGPVPQGTIPTKPGVLTVNPSTDTTAPAVPTGLRVVSTAPSEINLAWNAVTGDTTMYGYEVLRSDTQGGPYTVLALVTAAAYTDTNVSQGSTYFYVVRAVDLSYNRSGPSNEVQAVAQVRTVTVTFNVTVPASTDGTGRSVYIAGTLSRLNGGLPDWNPGATVLTRVDATHWTITLTGLEQVQIEYKYTLGDWDHVEKDGACGEIGNRQLTLSYGTNGVQTVNDTVLNWRNVAPCGN